jgi:hypothetical protein
MTNDRLAILQHSHPAARPGIGLWQGLQSPVEAGGNRYRHMLNRQIDEIPQSTIYPALAGG